MESMTSYSQALETSLAALVLDDRHAAAIQTARSIAAALDAKPTPSAVLLREWRPLVNKLVEWGTPSTHDDDDDGHAELVRLATMTSAALRREPS
jgi:hypothetical protein